MNRPQTTDAEVCVIGAGPAGSETARRLATLGHDVILLDRSAGPREHIICTGIVGREAFERLDLPRDAVVDAVRRARFRSPSGVEVVYEPRKPLAYVVDRTRFDEALARRAVNAGARLLRGWEARGLQKEVGGSGGVTLREADGRRTLRARACVVATGHWRWLHGPAGLGTPDEYVQGVHADLPFRDLDGAELVFGNGVAPGFFGWAIPFGDGTARLGILAPEDARPLFRSFLRRGPIRARLGLNLSNGGRETAREATLCRGIVQGPVTPSYSDRVLAVGEAAGQVKTTTAGGIYYGMIGAGVAAGVLHEALRAGAPGALGTEALSRYEDRWRKRLGREIDSGLELQAAARAMSDPEIDRLFRALQDGLGAAVRQVIRFDWHRPALRLLLRRLRPRALAALG